MGLLDELEQEAQRRKAGLDEATRLKEEREAAYRTQIEPGLAALRDYLAKLVASLSFLKPKRAKQYEIPGYGAVVANIEHEYELRANKHSPSAQDVVLNFVAVVATDECQPVVVQGPPKIRTLNAIFQKYRLAGIHEFKKDEAGEMVSATFRPRGKIPLNATFYADAETAMVKMSFTNIDTLGTVIKTVKPAEFNEQLFDEIGKFITGEPSTLFREALSEDFRKQLAHKVQQDQLRRKWESKIAEQQAEEEARRAREQGLKGRIDKAVKDVADKAPSLLDKVKGLFRK